MAEIIKNNNGIFLLFFGSIQEHFNWLNSLLIDGSEKLKSYSYEERRIIRDKAEKNAQSLGIVLNKQRSFQQ